MGLRVDRERAGDRGREGEGERERKRERGSDLSLPETFSLPIQSPCMQLHRAVGRDSSLV